MFLRFTFDDSMEVLVDKEEFGKAGIGAALDGMAERHGGVVRIDLEEGMAARRG